MEARKTAAAVIFLSFVFVPTTSVDAVDYQFGEREPVGPPASVPGRPDYNWSMTGDGLSVYYNPQLVSPHDIWVSTRSDFDASWSNPERLGSPVNDARVDDVSPQVSSDGLSLLFASSRAGGAGQRDIWMSTRSDPAGAWESVVNLAELNSSLIDQDPEIRFDGLEIFFARDFDDIYVSTRATTDDAWGTPVNLGTEVNFENRRSISPALTDDGLTMFFSSDLGNDELSFDIFMTSRPDLHSVWGPATRLGPEVNSSAVELAEDVGVDGYFYFERADALEAWESYEIYRAEIITVPEPSSIVYAGICLALFAGLCRGSLRMNPSR